MHGGDIYSLPVTIVNEMIKRRKFLFLRLRQQDLDFYLVLLLAIPFKKFIIIINLPGAILSL